jgi:hypothetical protein
MSPRRHSADLRGRRHDLGIAVRDMAAGLGIGLGRLLTIEDGTAAEEDKTFYRTWLSRIEGWSSSQWHTQLRRARAPASGSPSVRIAASAVA